MALAAAAASAVASIVDATRRLNITYPSWNVRHITNMYARPTPEHPAGSGRLYLPPHQRDWAWKGVNGLKKKRKFIDSVIHNFPVPMLILNAVDDGVRERWQIYDGRHRIETLWLFVNDEFALANGLRYSDLNPVDQDRIMERTIPVAVTAGATNEQLAEVFTRLNSGKALSQADYCWANNHTHLVSGTRAVLDTYVERLRPLFGGIDVKSRAVLPDWVGIVAGIITGNSGNMTTSFERLQDFLDTAVHPAVVAPAMEALVELYSRANATAPVATKDLKKYVKIGFINAFFLHDFMEAGTAVEKETVIANWTRVIVHIRTEADGKALVSVSGAQNLNSKKIMEVIRKVRRFLGGEAVEGEEEDVSDDTDSDSDV